MDEFKHIPVMLHECIKALKLKPGMTVVDATVGGAGHSAEIAKHIAGGRLICIDTDDTAIQAAKKRLKDIKNVEIEYLPINFRYIANHVKECGAILADLGVSSYQIDNPERGFSYMHDGELDMRMWYMKDYKSTPLNAYRIVNEYPEKKLAEIIHNYGEERYANRIASAIVAGRPVLRTLQLSEIIKNAVPAGYGKTGGHPAKRTFQAIRIAVNDELESLKEFLSGALGVLKPGGRLAVITFHSLEDRIVKQKFKLESADCICSKDMPQCVCRHRACIKIITKKPVEPAEEEIKQNPRSGSAKLRVAEKVKGGKL